MHPSNPRQADKDINLCAKSELVNSNSAILKVDKEIDDFSVPSINAENEKQLHMMHYGVIPGMSGQALTHSKRLQRPKTPRAPTSRTSRCTSRCAPRRPTASSC